MVKLKKIKYFTIKLPFFTVYGSALFPLTFMLFHEIILMLKLCLKALIHCLVSISTQKTYQTGATASFIKGIINCWQDGVLIKADCLYSIET